MAWSSNRRKKRRRFPCYGHRARSTWRIPDAALSIFHRNSDLIAELLLVFGTTTFTIAELLTAVNLLKLLPQRHPPP
eukprot:12924483-Prorocentrum_lima.AAC.1